MWSPGDPYAVSLFYRYFHIAEGELDEVIHRLEQLCLANALKGRCLVSSEGINGTLAGNHEGLKQFEAAAKSIHHGFAKIDYKYSFAVGAPTLPFSSLSVRQADELIACGTRIGDVIEKQVQFNDSYGGLEGTGEHLTPASFHRQVLDVNRKGEGIILDVRNVFEYEIGNFNGAVGLDTYYYSESWGAIDRRIDEYVQLQQKQPSKILMYCTGGIRCEKASAYLKAKGYPQVFQLQGGIHKYLDEFGDSPDSLFHGKNYVFDKRMALQSNSSTEEAETPVLGRCIDCYVPYDKYIEDRVCVVCRYPLLVCESCCARRPDSHCHRHQYLRDVYFSHLSLFTKSELERQEMELARLERELQGSQTRKSRRRMLRLQRGRVREEIDGRCDDK